MKCTFYSAPQSPSFPRLITAGTTLAAALLLFACGAPVTDEQDAPADDETEIAANTENSDPNMEIPLIIQPDRSLEELYDYQPEYIPNVPTFDNSNRPYLRSRGLDLHETEFVLTRREGEWVERDFIGALREAYPDFRNTISAGGTTETRVIFDSEDRAYTVLMINRAENPNITVMLYSTDFGHNWEAIELPSRSVAAEHRAGPNELDGPPFLMISERIADHEGRWAAQNRLLVTQPRWENNEIVIPEPIEVSDRLISLGQHSGGAPFAISRDGKTHFAWIELAEDEEAPGTPTFAATYDHETGEVSDTVFLAYAPPLNNSHNRPGIVMDSDGYLHVVTGAHHGESFFYTRSQEPNDTQSGWTEPTAVWDRGWTAVSGEEAGGQTYVSLVVDPDDTLHLVFRHWQSGIENFPHLADQGRDQFAALSYQQKPADGDWSEPRTLVVPARNVYSIFYQKLAINRDGQLFLSGSYYDRVLRDRSEEERFHHKFILTSDDAGESWRLAETGDFEATSGGTSE